MEKILGLDLGTHSIGWAVVERDGEERRLAARGVEIFQEGVARDKGGEKPAVQERTEARALRRHYARRRLRKIELLRVLVRHDLCPRLTDEQLGRWRSEKRYPMDEEFLRWQRTDEAVDRNPYRDRYRALTERLDLDRREERYALGRAFYHLAQRRGFLSNRKEVSEANEDGVVKERIRTLTAEMEEAGCRYLGEYFYELHRRGAKLRGRYAARNEHYRTEFRAICERQTLPAELVRELEHAIFFQRPLKSQKGVVGRCTFEPGKSRCPVSHPRFEEFRKLQFVNNIRVTGPGDAEPRPLTDEERGAIEPLFLRRSKPHFDFEELARKIAGRGRYACKDDAGEAPYRFNYDRRTTVSGCPVTALLRELFGDEWERELCAVYTLGAGKSSEQIVNDVWHGFSRSKTERGCRAGRASGCSCRTSRRSVSPLFRFRRAMPH